jgi:hypothetical protein
MLERIGQCKGYASAVGTWVLKAMSSNDLMIFMGTELLRTKFLWRLRIELDIILP